MYFRGAPINRITRLMAGVALLAFGGYALLTGLWFLDLVGIAVVLVGLGAVVVQGRAMWRERSDPYDLSKLWDKPPVIEEPEEDNKERTLAYCHHCGASLPEAYGICPQCGRPMGR